MVRINAVLSEDLIVGLDDLARENHKNRSELLREAAGKLIAEYRQKKEEELRLARIKKAVAEQDRLRRKAGGWDGAARVRQGRDENR